MAQSIFITPHQHIDKQRWNQCLQQCGNAMVYAHSDFLDAMSPGWNGIIIGDYEAIMPITWRSKLGISYLCQPAFAQQLGLFMQHPTQMVLLDDCLRRLTVDYRLIEIFLNHANPMPAGESLYQNFELDLHKPYAKIADGYKTDLQKNLKRSAKFQMLYAAGHDVQEAVSQFQNNYANRMGARPKDYQAFATLMNEWSRDGRCIIRKALTPTGELLAIALLANWNHRLYNLASTTLPNGRMMEANHFLFDQLIREFAGHNYVLDFEGSDQPGIARFYQKFGAVSKPYPSFRSNRLPAVIRWWKR